MSKLRVIVELEYSVPAGMTKRIQAWGTTNIDEMAKIDQGAFEENTASLADMINDGDNDMKIRVEVV